MEILRTPGGRAAIGLIATVIAAILTIYFLGDDAYNWVKAIHVVAVIAWMAGMLYLPRLFVYHADAEVGSELSETLKIMEGRLLRIIINPAMGITWALGLWMAWTAELYTSSWFIAKFVLVFAMSGVHGHFSAAVRQFANDSNQKSARYWRLMNEVPTVMMIAIVVLVIVKPF
ncbi:MAG: protoporphyrinogen oxidase HemJ [Hyphomicrobiaceae bacterium]